MRTLLALLLGLAVSVTALAAQPLLTPAELHGALANPKLRVIDIRDPKAYEANHIPGALNAPYGSWRGPANNPGELPPLPKLTALIQSLGLAPDTHAVVVSTGNDASDFGGAARIYWSMKVLGLKELSILNGGMKSWAAANLPQDKNPAKVAASTYTPEKLDAAWVVTKEEVLARVKSNQAALIDARPAEFYKGDTRHPAAKTNGTLHGAVNLEHDKWFAPGNATFVSTDQTKKIAADFKLDAARETVSFCNTGHWAATNWFAMSEVLRQKDVKLYPGSMVDWTNDSASLPMDNVPGRMKQLVLDTQLWFQRTFK